MNFKLIKWKIINTLFFVFYVMFLGELKLTKTIFLNASSSKKLTYLMFDNLMIDCDIITLFKNIE